MLVTPERACLTGIVCEAPSVDQRLVVVEAAASAARQLESGVALAGSGPEACFRNAIAEELKGSGLVAEVRYEWKPELPDWPSAAARDSCAVVEHRPRRS